MELGEEEMAVAVRCQFEDEAIGMESGMKWGVQGQNGGGSKMAPSNLFPLTPPETQLFRL